MRSKVAVALVALFAATGARADYENRLIGNWVVSAEEDRFGDGGTFIAMTGDGAYVFAVRCIQKKLTIGIADASPDPHPLTKGDLFTFSFRVDKNPVVQAEGVAINERLIQMDTEKSLVKSVRDGKETAMKIVDATGAASIHIFKTIGAPKAFADLSKECPLD